MARINYLLFISLIVRSDEINWMEFESRMRKVIKDIMDPLIDKVKKQET
jgi:hypothetical protein